MLWAVFAAMTLVALAALLLPYLRSRGATTVPRAAYDLEIYRDQLGEIERDEARGLIGPAEAKAARTEIARRALAADADAKATAKPAPELKRRMPAFAWLAAGAAPLAALAVYLSIGSPGMPSQTFLAEHVANARSEQEMVGRLEQRMKEQPDDPQGWLLLARSYSTMGRADDAVRAWREALKRIPNTTQFAGQFAEALVQAAGGTVTPEAVSQFQTAATADPRDPRPRYYLGLAKAQAGDNRAALQTWTDLVAVSPPDAPWLPLVRDQIAGLATQAKIDPATITPSPEAQEVARTAQAAPAAPGPNAADIAEMEKLSPEERMGRIRTMVDALDARLQAKPDDVDGWLRLARARQVLGEGDQAVDAYAKAAKLAPDRLEVQTAYADALFQHLPKEGKLPADFVALMRHILDLDPNYGDALWFVGMAEAEAGNRMAAIALWQRLIDKLPPDGKERAQIQTQIDRLKAAADR
jgi:cytochrome c-type biogenesis protein CcmH